MSKILLRLLQFFHPTFFFCFSSFLICKCFQSILFRNSFERVTQESESQDGSSDISIEENSAREEDLIADVLNGETLLFLPYKVDRNGAIDEICEVNKAHEVIYNSDSISREEYNPKDADDEKCEETKTDAKEERKETQIEENEVPRKPKELEEKQIKENEVARKPEELEEKNDGDNGEENGRPRKQELDVRDGGVSGEERKDGFMAMEDGASGEERKDGFMAMVQFTAETTSKISWEWRSSTNYRDSEMEDLYSSSSSSSADSLFIKKYDEEMMFYDKISAQKLQETVSLCSFSSQVNCQFNDFIISCELYGSDLRCLVGLPKSMLNIPESFRMMNPLPRSVSKRIMINLRGYLKETPRLREDVRNPQQELEAAYVAQICLTWEALNWNYKNFKKLMAGKEDAEFGYYAHVAQQFQQFQVLLQQFIEIEPYEHGRRPEIYARTRISSSKLLQVPELRESNVEGEATEETRISTAELLELMEESIRIFMEFLKAEKEDKCVIFKRLCRRLRRKELKEMQRRRRYFTRRLKLKRADQFEVLLALIDVKVVLRVLKTARLNEEQLHWCEQKINKLRVDKDKIQRDSCPLFYPCR
ncbi:hypothetical protein EJ110_NYTH30327 [Nymphaea thermarum]|nr:hypothetical protein EJ110_NYTH30327 [Nymphaea thermarum]